MHQLNKSSLQLATITIPHEICLFAPNWIVTKKLNNIFKVIG